MLSLVLLFVVACLYLRRRVVDLEHLEDGCAVVGDGHIADRVDQHLKGQDRKTRT